MLNIDNFIFASSITEAYNTLLSVPDSVVLGGCCYLRLGKRKIGTAIDLSKLGLDFIREADSTLEIGAMTSLRILETDIRCNTLWNGVLKHAVKNIVGIQLRSCATVGGTIAGRYPFSDLLTALLALDAQLLFHHHGQISLEKYLERKPGKDILEKIVIPIDGRLAAFSSVRKTKTDYAVLNVAVAKTGMTYRVIVGSRPGRAMNVDKAAHYLNKHGLDNDSIAEAGKIAVSTLKFGANPRGSAAYRKAICPVLIQRACKEVMDAA